MFALFAALAPRCLSWLRTKLFSLSTKWLCGLGMYVQTTFLWCGSVARCDVVSSEGKSDERSGMRRHARQTSESIELAILLTLSGGLMDAYSYLGRGQVFANAQTGNLLLLGVNLAAGEFGRAARYAFPVASFALGIALAQVFKLKDPGRIHWRQWVVLLEVALLAMVSMVPETSNLLANSMTSLACGMQVQAFRKLHGRGFATTMCIGNLRSGTHALVTYWSDRNVHTLRSAGLYYGTIACFVCGAILGMWVLSLWGLAAILVSCVLLAAALILMFEDREAQQA